MNALEATEIELGDRVVDSDPNGAPSAMRVVDLPEERADEFYIAAIGQLVSEVNGDYPASDPVVGAIFEAERDSESATVYHFPLSRVRPIPEDWEPPTGGGRSSGKREREETFGGHENAVEMFIEDLRKALSEPEGAAVELLTMLTVDEEDAGVANAESVMMDMATPNAHAIRPRSTDGTPRTRGECRNSRNDKYRPEDDDAMCCWECSNRSHNRPKKFKRGDSTESACSRGGESAWELRESVVEHIDLTRLPDGFAETYSGDHRRLLRDLTALQSGDEDRIRKAALRMAYRPHLGGVEEYNYSRTMALLRDRGVAGELPIIGDNGGGSQ